MNFPASFLFHPNPSARVWVESVSSHESKTENRAVNFFAAPSHKEFLARKILRWGLFIKQGLSQKQMQDSHVRGARLSSLGLICIQGGHALSSPSISFLLPWRSVWPSDLTCFFPNIRMHKCQTQPAFWVWELQCPVPAASRCLITRG